MIRLALRRLLLLAAWSAVLLLLTRPLIRNTDNVSNNKHEDAQVMDKLDQGGLNKFALLWGEAQLCLPYVCL